MVQGGTLTIGSSVGDQIEADRFLEISISDTGNGFSDEMKDNMFDPFVKGKDQGIGLGLSISQRIAELHHGWISAKNNNDKGATFTVHLPVKS
jgi:two-component system, LuxR family, sensor kinase FixL